MLDEVSGASPGSEPEKTEADLLSGLRAQYLKNSMRKTEALILLISRRVADSDRSIRVAESILNPATTCEHSKSDVIEDSQDLSDALRLSHNFVGSGSSYGFSEITAQARLIEASLKRYQAEPMLSDLLDALSDACLLRAKIRCEHEKV